MPERQIPAAADEPATPEAGGPGAIDGPAASVHTVVRDAAARFVAAGILPDEARLDAELLAREVLGWDRATFIVHAREAPPPELIARLPGLVGRRESREPAAYVLGHREFWGLDVEVTPDVLVPRPETELIVEEALARYPREHPPAVIVDAGTGSGCLAIALATEYPGARIVATDVSAAALAVARRNARRCRVSDRIAFRLDRHCGEVAGAALIVSNPPYVPDADLASLPPEVRDFEPRIALAGGPDGLDVVRDLLRDASDRLESGRWLIVEIGAGQDEAVGALLDSARRPSGDPVWCEVAIRRDLQGMPRVVSARRA
jgi:release factor glutamine methyltransferase